MTAVESHSTTHVSRTRIAQLGDELMSTLTFVTPDTRFPPTGAKYKPALVDINYRATRRVQPSALYSTRQGLRYIALTQPPTRCHQNNGKFNTDARNTPRLEVVSGAF